MLGWVIVNYWLQPAYYQFSSLAGSKDWFLLEHNHNWPKVLNLCIPTTIYVCWFVFRLLWAKISRKVGNNWWYWSVTWVMVSTHQMRGDSSAQTVTPHYKLPFCSAIFKTYLELSKSHHIEKEYLAATHSYTVLASLTTPVSVGATWDPENLTLIWITI